VIAPQDGISSLHIDTTPDFAVFAFTAAAAIGASTTIFSLLDAVLLKSVNVHRADRLILLRVQPGDYGYGFNYPWFRCIEQESSSLMQVFGFLRRSLRLTTLSGIEDVSGNLSVEPTFWHCK
jgi:hypothetical protein